jgi:hypothetical protein
MEGRDSDLGAPGDEPAGPGVPPWEKRRRIIAGVCYAGALLMAGADLLDLAPRVVVLGVGAVVLGIVLLACSLTFISRCPHCDRSFERFVVGAGSFRPGGSRSCICPHCGTPLDAPRKSPPVQDDSPSGSGWSTVDQPAVEQGGTANE